jgi:hypothetical protein
MTATEYVTARVLRQGPDLHGRRRRRFGYHAVACQPVTIGREGPLGPLCPVSRVPGEALCGASGPWQQPGYGLFAAPLGCERCARIAAREGIAVLGLPQPAGPGPGIEP